MTRRFLAAEARQADWAELAADPDAEYVKAVDIDLAELVPPGGQAPQPRLHRHRAGEPRGSRALHRKLHELLVRELATVARILRGRVAHPRVSFIVTPGSRQVLENLARDGYLADCFVLVRITVEHLRLLHRRQPQPRVKGVSLRTSNRNFYGRSGTEDAEVYP